MDKLTNLTANVSAGQAWPVPVGLPNAVTHEHAEKAGWIVKIMLGGDGIVFTNGTTEIAIGIEDLYSLATAKQPLLLPQLPPVSASVVNRTVALGCSQAGAVIHYTTDGSTPTAESATYSEPIALEAAGTLKAIAVKSGWRASVVGSVICS